MVDLRATAAVFRAIWHPEPRIESRAAVEAAAAAIDRLAAEAALVRSMQPEGFSSALSDVSERFGR